MTNDCDDGRDALAGRLKLFFGDSHDAAARVYARLACDETTTGTRLAGELIGPECRFAQTLSARIPFQDRGPGESLLAEAVVPDPCFWTPELPMLYRARIRGQGSGVRGQELGAGGGQGLEGFDRGLVVTGSELESKEFTTVERWVGIRRLGVRGPSLILDTDRWVARGIWLERIGVDELKAAREANAVLGGPPPGDDICLEASRHGVPLLVELPGHTENLVAEVRRLGQWPAVFLLILEPRAAVDSAVRSAARNLLFAARFAVNEPIVALRGHKRFCAT